MKLLDNNINYNLESHLKIKIFELKLFFDHMVLEYC
jgi:hypothetical protein